VTDNNKSEELLPAWAIALIAVGGTAFIGSTAAAAIFIGKRM